MYVHIESRGQYQMSFFKNCLSCFSDRVSHLRSEAHWVGQADWPACPRDPVSAPRGLLQAHVFLPSAGDHIEDLMLTPQALVTPLFSAPDYSSVVVNYSHVNGGFRLGVAEHGFRSRYSEGRGSLELRTSTKSHVKNRKRLETLYAMWPSVILGPPKCRSEWGRQEGRRPKGTLLLDKLAALHSLLDKFHKPLSSRTQVDGCWTEQSPSRPNLESAFC